MKNVLILGIGYAQKDALVYLKDFGYRTFACSNIDHGPALDYVDQFYQIDIANLHEICKVAIRENIDLVYSIGSDLAMPTCSYVSAKQGLPSFYGYDTALDMHDKARMRSKLKALGSATVSYTTLDDLNSLIWSEFPAVMKPVDSQGQRGIFIVNSTEEIVSNFHLSARYSKSSTVIVESYIDGQEYSVNSYLVNGKAIINYITKRISYPEYPGGIIKEHVWENNDYEWADELFDLVDQIAIHFSLRNGPLYIQFKVNQYGRIKVIEIAPRLDGCHLWRLIKETSNIDLLDITFKHLFGKSFEPPTEHIVGEGKFKLGFMGTKPELPVLYDWLAKQGTLVYNEYYRNGDIVDKTNGYIEKTGYWIKKV